jgi:hypothetical protein
MVRVDVKMIYHPDANLQGGSENGLVTPEGPTTAFGMIAAQPEYWESLELTDPYIQSVRTKYEQTSSGWTESRIPLS